MVSTKNLLLIFILLFSWISLAEAMRNDVLVVVNDNSIDSPQVGTYYAQQRGIDPANIVHVHVPNSYFIDWSQFRLLRDQLIHYMQSNTLDDPALTPATCADGEPPYYCAPATEQLRLHSRIRYLVTTRGVPTRVTVDGSSLTSPTTPSSVDNYLKYWLINYFSGDIRMDVNERESAFGDGRGMRQVNPAVDRELIVGRIDGLNSTTANALVDRALAAERNGIYGTWYGATPFFRWRDASNKRVLYPRSGNPLLGWRYPLGLFGEDRPECMDYLNFSGFILEGKSPTYCRVQFNDDFNPAVQSVSYPATGNVGSRQPMPVDAFGYQGWLDGQQAACVFGSLLSWRTNGQ